MTDYVVCVWSLESAEFDGRGESDFDFSSYDAAMQIFRALQKAHNVVALLVVETGYGVCVDWQHHQNDKEFSAYIWRRMTAREKWARQI